MKWQTKRALARLLVALIFVIAVPGLQMAAQEVALDKEAFNRISDKLICQCGCNYGLSHCPHLQCPSAPVLRSAIREKLAAGQTDQQILEAMVAEFGPAVLAAPPAEGFNLSAWVMPFLALGLGLWAAITVVRRWRRREAPPAADPALVDRYRAHLEREMKELEK